jgi:hypothetical protein
MTNPIRLRCMLFFSYFQNNGNGNFESFCNSMSWEDHANAMAATLVVPPNACWMDYSVNKIELFAIVETLKEFKGMLCSQSIKVFTDHANRIRDVLGMPSDRVYQRRLLLEEYGPKIVYIKGIYNTIADVISRLEYDPSVN